MVYAVATGNSFILKPSERDPRVPQRLFELIDGVGFSDGVVQLVNGGKDTVNALLDHEGFEGISFVDSTPITKLVYERAAANGKRVQAQGSAKNHIIVTLTADLKFAAEQTIFSACACVGERCLANDVILIEESVYDEFSELVVAEADDQVSATDWTMKQTSARSSAKITRLRFETTSRLASKRTRRCCETAAT